LRTSNDRLRDLGGRLLHAQEDERARIAGELHDDISQQMAALAIDLQLITRVRGDGAARIRRLAGDAFERSQAVMDSVRGLSHRLHPANLRLIGLVPALANLQREFSASLPVAFEHSDMPPAVSDDVALCLFRVAQEALQNAVKHAGARAITMSLRGWRHGLE